MSKIGYAGEIYQDLALYLAIPDKYTFGQKLTQIEKEVKKRFIDMEDVEILSVLKFLLSTKEYYKDEKLTDEEFKNWIENVNTN